MSRKTRAGADNPDVAELQDKWGVVLDPELLILALTHRSFANEMGGLPNNERLEFLGDSVLGLVVTEELYATHPQVPESQLAKLRSAVVSQRPLAQVARELDLGSYILLGVGEHKTGGREKDSILSDTLEALIGATYITSGLEPTRSVLLHHLRGVLEAADEPESVMDWKTPLREFALANRMGEVSFDVRGEGPDHDRHFYATVLAGEQPLGTGDGPSRKEAENDSAKHAYLALTDGHVPDGRPIGNNA
ncbi:ribonuclease III [Actinomycetaceae bacterium MB13-C1-2]|nr:ribonuclease III [Actinomycetaceae bacterium MB13-C1-2]